MAYPDPGFFPGFATYSVFEGFAGLEEPSEGAVKGGGPAGLTAEDYCWGLVGRDIRREEGKAERRGRYGVCLLCGR